MNIRGFCLGHKAQLIEGEKGPAAYERSGLNRFQRLCHKLACAIGKEERIELPDSGVSASGPVKVVYVDKKSYERWERGSHLARQFVEQAKSVTHMADLCAVYCAQHELKDFRGWAHWLLEGKSCAKGEGNHEQVQLIQRALQSGLSEQPDLLTALRAIPQENREDLCDYLAVRIETSEDQPTLEAQLTLCRHCEEVIAVLDEPVVPLPHAPAPATEAMQSLHPGALTRRQIREPDLYLEEVEPNLQNPRAWGHIATEYESRTAFQVDVREAAASRKLSRKDVVMLASWLENGASTIQVAGGKGDKEPQLIERLALLEDCGLNLMQLAQIHIRLRPGGAMDGFLDKVFAPAVREGAPEYKALIWNYQQLARDADKLPVDHVLLRGCCEAAVQLDVAQVVTSGAAQATVDAHNRVEAAATDEAIARARAAVDDTARKAAQGHQEIATPALSQPRLLYGNDVALRRELAAANGRLAPADYRTIARLLALRPGFDPIKGSDLVRLSLIQLLHVADASSGDPKVRARQVQPLLDRFQTAEPSEQRTLLAYILQDDPISDLRQQLLRQLVPHIKP